MVKQWIRSNDVVCEKLDGQVLLVSPRSGARWLLNAAAAAVWNLCDGTRSLADMAANLAEAGIKDARNNVAALCSEFENLGLLQAAAGARRAEPQWVPCLMKLDAAPNFRQLSAGSGGRRRPSPHGVSGPV